MVLVIAQQPLALHPRQLAAHGAAVHAQIVGQLLAVVGDVKAVLPGAFHALGKVRHEPGANALRRRVQDALRELQILGRAHGQQVLDELGVKRAGVRAGREHLADVQKQHLGVLRGGHADEQRLARDAGIGLGKHLTGADVAEQTVVAPDVVIADHGHAGEHHAELFGRRALGENGLAPVVVLLHRAETLQQQRQLIGADAAKEMRVG